MLLTPARFSSVFYIHSSVCLQNNIGAGGDQEGNNVDIATIVQDPDSCFRQPLNALRATARLQRVSNADDSG